MSLLGAGFDPTQPLNTLANQINVTIRDVKQRLKDFASVSFDLDTGALKPGIVASSALVDTGVTAGTYKSVTVNAKGQVTAGTNPTTLAGFGITDGLSNTTVITAAQGGNGNSVNPSNGQIAIGNGTNTPTLATLTPGNFVTITNAPGVITIGLNLPIIPFHSTAILSSAAAATAVNLVANASLSGSQKLYVTGFIVRVNGATAWATVATVKLQDTNGTPIDFITIAAAGLTANATLVLGSGNVTIEAAVALGSGGNLLRGLQVKGDVNGTGSDLYVTAFGYIKG